MLILQQTKKIKLMRLACSHRHLPPTEAGIEAMVKSLREHGQLAPILVHKVSNRYYRIIAGATRYEAAKRLRWPQIDARIARGDYTEFKIVELIENLDRRELTEAQRREMRKEIKELQMKAVADVEPAKGGRGKKGGVSEAARAAGMSRRTASRRKRGQNTESAHVSERRKLNQNTESGSVSERAEPKQRELVEAEPYREPTPIDRIENKPHPTFDAKQYMTRLVPVRFTDAEFKAIEAFRSVERPGQPRSDTVRELCRAGLKELSGKTPLHLIKGGRKA